MLQIDLFALQQALARQGLQRFVQDIVVPLTRRVGEAWESGRFEVFEEHLFTELTKRVLRQAIIALPRGLGAPRVVLTTSDRAMYQRYAQAGLVAYAAGKMAQLGIMNALSMEGAAHGILVNAVSPVAKTRMWGISGQPPDLTPEAVAPGVIYLASADCHDSGYILRASNGQFSATRFEENPGVDYPLDLARVHAASAVDVARLWASIKETRHA